MSSAWAEQNESMVRGKVAVKKGRLRERLNYNSVPLSRKKVGPVHKRTERDGLGDVWGGGR